MRRRERAADIRGGIHKKESCLEISQIRHFVAFGLQFVGAVEDPRARQAVIDRLTQQTREIYGYGFNWAVTGENVAEIVKTAVLTGCDPREIKAELQSVYGWGLKLGITAENSGEIVRTASLTAEI